MKQKYQVLTFGVIITSLFFIVLSCRKINQATELGGGLIPAVDNITTFDTTITVEAYNDLFTNMNDSLRLSGSEEHFLGIIDNAHKDPLFGTTDARLFLELKPSFYKYYFVTDKSHLRIDSAVLILDYVKTYGDTNTLQNVKVYEINQNYTDFRSDSAYLIRENNIPKTTLLGQRTFAPSILDDSVKAYQDTTKNQLRIRLDNSFGTRLLQYDTTGTSGPTAAYVSDSLFRTNFRGFALESTTGKALMGFNLNGANTKLALYYKYDKGASLDTPGVVYFNFTSACASANWIQRNYSGAQIATVQGGTSPDNLVFLQNNPGSFATLKIPDLARVNNRLVHRAELIAEEVYDPTDTIFRAPTYLYLDAYDPAISKFRTIPYDLTFDNSGAVNITSFGMSPQSGKDVSGNAIKVWKFNITRYIQHVLTGTESRYDLRLFAPFFVNNQFRQPPSTTDFTRLFIINPTITTGRVRLAGGTPGLQKMRLHIIYSKL